MTTPDQPSKWSTRGLHRLATNFSTQEHVGVLGSLLLRFARSLGGDPSTYILLSSTGPTNPISLPDDVRMLSAVLHVQGNSIIYRVDGLAPTASDALVPVGSVLELTGQPTLKGFQFASSSAITATLVGEYYD